MTCCTNAVEKGTWLTCPDMKRAVRVSSPARKIQVGCFVHQLSVIELILHHELCQVSHHLAAGRHLQPAQMTICSQTLWQITLLHCVTMYYGIKQDCLHHVLSLNMISIIFLLFVQTKKATGRHKEGQLCCTYWRGELALHAVVKGSTLTMSPRALLACA